MDWKKTNSLKSLNWNDILHKTSDDEYDSDETCCEMNISTIDDVKETKDFSTKDAIENITDTKKLCSTSFSENAKSNYPTLDEKRAGQSKRLETMTNNKGTQNIDLLNSPHKSCSFGKKIQEISLTEQSIDYSSAVQYMQHESNQYSIPTPRKPLRRYRKSLKVISKKSLPKRKCYSTFINNSRRAEVVEEYKSSSDTEENEVNNISVHTNENIIKKGSKNSQGKIIKKRRGRKRKNIDNNNGTLLDLKQIEVELKVIEDKVEGWITGIDEEPLSRQQTFEMLTESQNLIKLLEIQRQEHVSLSCSKDVKLTNKLLLKRAIIVSEVIDKAIAEADRLMSIDETTNVDTTPESEIREDSLDSFALKSILKSSSTFDSEESNEFSIKHVSFSDDIQYHYFSDSEGSIDVNNSLRGNFSNEKCENLKDLTKWGTKYDENTTEKLVSNADNTKKLFSELRSETTEHYICKQKEDTIEEENIKDATNSNEMINKNHISKSIIYNKQISHDNPIEYYVTDKENITLKTSTNVQTSQLNTKVQCISKEEKNVNVDQLKDSNIDIIDSNANMMKNSLITVDYKNSNQENHIKGICNDTFLISDKQALEHSESSLNTTQQILADNEDGIQSESFSCDENSYGFSKMVNKFDEEAWNNITIMSIKAIRIRGDDEYNSVADASFSADDFKW